MTPIRVRRLRTVTVVAAILVAAVAVLAVLAVARHRSDDHASGPATTGRTTVAATPADTFPVGITFGGALTGLPRARVDAALADVVALHMTWIRIDLSWAALQPSSPDRFAWSATDGIVASARRHGLHVLGLLTYTPPWARAPGCGSFVCPPRSPAAFSRFAAAVVHRYASQGVTSYQLWNEPNLTVFWRDPDPRAYGTMLRAAVSAMRAAQRGLRILFGGLAQVATDAGNIDPGRFLSRACPCPVDAVGFDPYTYPALPGDLRTPLNAWQLMTNPAASGYGIRAALPAGLRIWVTQFGAPTAYRGGTDPRLVSDARQAAILTDGLRLARQPGTVVAAYFVNTWRDTSGAGGTRDHFGIERADGTRKPAFAALQRALAR